MILFRVFVYLVFLILVGVGMVSDIRRRTFPVWIGWLLLGIALAYLSVAGQWGRVAMLLAVILGFRLRRIGWIAILCLVAVSILLRNTELSLLYLMAIGFYFLFVAGWVGACDAEIAFPLLALTGDDTMLIYIVAGWILVPPIVVFLQKGIRGGIRRFFYVAKALLSGSASPKNDPEALRWPWAATAFAALTIYYFIFPAIIIHWAGEILS